MPFLFIWQFLISGTLEMASGYAGTMPYVSYIFPDLESSLAAWRIPGGPNTLAAAALPRRDAAFVPAHQGPGLDEHRPLRGNVRGPVRRHLRRADAFRSSVSTRSRRSNSVGTTPAGWPKGWGPP